MAKPPKKSAKGSRRPKKQTSDKMSKLASDVLAGRKKPTTKETKQLAASVLGQDETKGKLPTKAKPKPKPKKPTK